MRTIKTVMELNRMKTMVKMRKMKKVVKTQAPFEYNKASNESESEFNLYSTHVEAIQTKYYCTVLNMEIVYENNTLYDI